ncbi:dipeptidase [Gemmatimonadota bacterium]
MDRRRFVAGVSGGLVAAPALARAAVAAGIGGSQERPIILDANGEIRLTHPMSLIREVIASGTMSESVTFTDPKVFGEAALDTALDDLLAYDRHIREHSDLLIKAAGVADIHRARSEGKLAIFYQLQNTTPIQKDLDRVDMFYNLGLRSLQLTYNYQNYVGTGCRDRFDGGLTVFGIELIERMNEIGLLIDTSHANMKTMSEAIAHSKVPTTVSHTGCESVYSHVRNTTDENLRALADSGGVVGLCQIRPFLTGVHSEDNVRFYFDHIDHAVKVAGIDHVCIGSDRDHRVIEDSEEELALLLEEEGAQFDPRDWPLYMPALNGPRRMEVVWDGLLGRGYSEGEVEKIMGLNLLRLYTEVIG